MSNRELHFVYGMKIKERQDVMANEKSQVKQNASNLFECPTCGECYTTLTEAEGCKDQHCPDKSMDPDKFRPTLHPTPAHFWHLVEVSKDGDEVPCKDMPQAYPQPDDLVPALRKFLAQDRNIHIRPTMFTDARAAITLYKKMMTPIEIQLATDWSNEAMKEIERVADILIIAESLPTLAADLANKANELLSKKPTGDAEPWGEANTDH